MSEEDVRFKVVPKIKRRKTIYYAWVQIRNCSASDSGDHTGWHATCDYNYELCRPSSIPMNTRALKKAAKGKTSEAALNKLKRKFETIYQEDKERYEKETNRDEFVRDHTSHYAVDLTQFDQQK